MRHRLFLFTACMGLATLGGASPLRAQARPAAPATVDPASLPAHETHQGVTVAVRPLTTDAAYKTQFPGKQTPYDSGILALEVFFRNDNDKPIRLKLITMRLLVDRGNQPQRIEPLTAEEVADRVLLKTPSNVRAPRLPIPGTGRPTSNRDKNWQEYAGRIQAAGIPSDIVGPKATVRGFLFFDVDHHYDWLTDARLDVPDIAFMLNNEALFFFQVDLAPALR